MLDLQVLSHAAGNQLTEMKGSVEERCQNMSQKRHKERILSPYSDLHLRPFDFSVNCVTDY